MKSFLNLSRYGGMPPFRSSGIGEHNAKTALSVILAMALFCANAFVADAKTDAPKQDEPKTASSPVTPSPVAPIPVAPIPEPVKEPVPPRPSLDPAVILEKQVALLLESLTGNDPMATEEARRELLEIGRPTVPFLLKALETAKPDLRYMVVEIISDLRDERAINYLVKLLADSDEYTASIASVSARALGRMGSNIAIPHLMKSITSTDVELRYESIKALGLLRAKEALPLIKLAISDTAQTFLGYYVRIAAIQSLGWLMDASSVKELIPLLRNTDVEPATEQPVARYAVKSLEYITDYKTGSFSARTDQKKKDEIIKAWEDWWEKNKKNYE
ncbi:MAG: HEAT repeat domain-containing protein [Planctomycetota bacterium]